MQQPGTNATQPASARAGTTPSPTAAPPDFRTLQPRQRALWGAGDFGILGTKILLASELLCEAVDLRAGERVLDVACGHGNTALAAARRSALATGLDIVPSLLERARERAAAERLDVAWREGDAQELPFGEGAFDVVLSTFGVMFAPDQPRAARELLRVCRPGGRVGLSCWTPAGFAGQMLKVVGSHVAPPAGLLPPTRWGTVDGLEALLGDGVGDLVATPRLFQMRYSSPEHFLEVHRTWFGPLKMAFAALDVDGQAALAADLLDLTRRADRSGGSSLVVPSEYLEVVAVRR
jgi:SAM-dependent methyltransferase